MAQFLRIRYISKQVYQRLLCHFWQISETSDFQWENPVKCLELSPHIHSCTSPLPYLEKFIYGLTLCWNLSLLFLSASPQAWKINYSPTLISVSEIVRDCTQVTMLCSLHFQSFFHHVFSLKIYFLDLNLSSVFFLAHKHPSYGTEATSKHFTSLCCLVVGLSWQEAV